MPDRFSLPLVSHPAQPHPSTLTVSTDGQRMADGSLVLRYRFAAPAGTLLIPTPQPPGPADNLWQHTCCEAFIAPPGTDAYLEFNLSPSGQWAVYRFTGYRQRDIEFVPAAQPTLEFATTPEGYTLTARLPTALLPAGELAASLTTVSESTDGSKHYWALTHAGEQPDFHLPQSFTLRLPPATP